MFDEHKIAHGVTLQGGQECQKYEGKLGRAGLIKSITYIYHNRSSLNNNSIHELIKSIAYIYHNRLSLNNNSIHEPIF